MRASLAIQTGRSAIPKDKRTKINYRGIIPLYIDVVKSQYTIYRYFALNYFAGVLSAMLLVKGENGTMQIFSTNNTLSMQIFPANDFMFPQMFVGENTFSGYIRKTVYK